MPGGNLRMGSSDDEVDFALSLCEQYPGAYGKCASDDFGEYPLVELSDSSTSDSGALKILRGGSWGYVQSSCDLLIATWFHPQLTTWR